MTAIVSLGLQHLKRIWAASQSHSSVTTSTCPKKCQKLDFFFPQNKLNVLFQCIYSHPHTSKALLKVFWAGTGEVDCVAGKFLWTFYDILICWSTIQTLSSITAVTQRNVTSFCSNLSTYRQQLFNTQKGFLKVELYREIDLLFTIWKTGINITCTVHHAFCPLQASATVNTGIN